MWTWLVTGKVFVRHAVRPGKLKWTEIVAIVVCLHSSASCSVEAKPFHVCSSEGPLQQEEQRRAGRDWRGRADGWIGSLERATLGPWTPHTRGLRKQSVANGIISICRMELGQRAQDTANGGHDRAHAPNVRHGRVRLVQQHFSSSPPNAPLSRLLSTLSHPCAPLPAMPTSTARSRIPSTAVVRL